MPTSRGFSNCIGLNSFDHVDESFSEFSGKHRRILRAIAEKMKNEKVLPIISFNNPEGLSTEIFKANTESALLMHELVQVKFPFVEKKKEAKILGEELSMALKCELVQVLGHGILLYKSKTPVGEVTALLKDRLRTRKENVFKMESKSHFRSNGNSII